MTAPLRRRTGADVKLLRAPRRGRRHFGILSSLAMPAIVAAQPPLANVREPTETTLMIV
jgi:hypothetical protein